MKFKYSMLIIVVTFFLFGCTELYQPPQGELVDLLPESITNCNGFTKHIVKVYGNIPIASAFNDLVTEGQFFLGCGTINGVEYIFTYIKIDNVYQRKQIEIKNLRIIETDEFSPKFVKAVYGTVKENGQLRLTTRYTHNFLIIPLNTIMKKFELK